MRAWIQLALTLLLSVTGALNAYAQTRELGASGILLDGVAAVVDEGVVLKSELQERTQIVLNNLRQAQAELPPEQRRPLPPVAVIERQVLDQLILRQIQLQRAQRFGIEVNDEMINQALAQIAQGFGLTLGQLPAALASEGINYATYRQDSREELILEQLERREVMSRIAIAPREMNLCLARLEANASEEIDYNVSHILISLSAAAAADEVSAAEQRAQDVMQRLEAGEDFAQVAIAYSDSQDALEGGALGWRKGGQLPTLFGDVVTDMKPGQISSVLRSSSGFHIVRLNETRGTEPVMVDRFRARHILLQTNELLDDDAVQQKMRGIRDQIVGGDDFATVAQAVSEDSVSAVDGGDLGWIEPGQFVPEFERELAQLDIGELSQPFRTRFGWHIAEVTERRSFDTTEEIKQQRCATEIRASKAEEERELWLRRIRDEAFVEILI
jgi:peptidyl-prolyl cis-trans isomerase SurA